MTGLSSTLQSLHFMLLIKNILIIINGNYK